MLSKVKYYDRTFTQRRLYFAFDDVSLADVIKKKLKILTNYVKPYHLMFYVLVGFNTEFSQDMFRFDLLRTYGCDPYIMIYNNRRDKPILRHFARWVNKRIYKAQPDFLKYNKLTVGQITFLKESLPLRSREDIITVNRLRSARHYVASLHSTQTDNIHNEKNVVSFD